MTWASILVVEDEQIVARDLMGQLVSLGYGVLACVGSGDEAVNVALERKPDLVLLDIRLGGGIDGIQTAKQLRASLDVPVCFVTAYADAETLDRAKEVDPYGYIIKPFQKRDLKVSIEIALYRHRMDKRLRDRERWLTTVLSCIRDSVIACDESGAVKFLNENAETLTGWPSSEAIGVPIDRVLQPTPDSSASAAKEALRTHQVVERSGDSIVTREGKRVVVEETATPITNEAKVASGVVVVIRPRATLHVIADNA